MSCQKEPGVKGTLAGFERAPLAMWTLLMVVLEIECLGGLHLHHRTSSILSSTHLRDNSMRLWAWLCTLTLHLTQQIEHSAAAHKANTQ